MKKTALLVVCFLFILVFIGCEKKDESESLISSKIETQQESVNGNMDTDEGKEGNTSLAITYLSGDLTDINELGTFRISGAADFNIRIDKFNTIMLDDENLLHLNIVRNADNGYLAIFYNISLNKDKPAITKLSEQTTEHDGNLIAYNGGFALVNDYKIECTLFDSTYTITDYKKLERDDLVGGVVYSNNLTMAAYRKTVFDTNNTDNPTITNTIYLVDIDSGESSILFEQIEAKDVDILLTPFAFTHDDESLIYCNYMSYLGEQSAGGGIINVKTSEIKTFDTSQISEPNGRGLNFGRVIFGAAEDSIWLTNWVMGMQWDYQVNGVLDLLTGDYTILPLHEDFARILNQKPEEVGLNISFAGSSPTFICTYSGSLFLYDISTGLPTLVLRNSPESLRPHNMMLSPSKSAMISISESDNDLVIDFIVNGMEHNSTKIDIDNDGTVETVVYNVYEKRFVIYKNNLLLNTTNAMDLEIRYSGAWGRGGQGYSFTTYNGENYIKILSYIPSMDGDGTDRVLIYKFSGNQWVKIEEITNNLDENISTINDTVVSDEEMKNAVDKYTDIAGTEYSIDVYK